MDYEKARSEMVRLQLKERGISDKRVLEVMGRVAREDFLEEKSKKFAYIDSPLAISSGQTISQPYMLARLLELLALRGDENILEIGTGSGYSTALLSLLGKNVVSIERQEDLFKKAGINLAPLIDRGNIELIKGDGSLGLSGKTFAAIIVHAVAPSTPPSLLKSLAPGGRMIIPLKEKDGGDERLHLIKRDDQGRTEETLLDFCHFVPLVGKEGFANKS